MHSLETFRIRKTKTENLPPGKTTTSLKSPDTKICLKSLEKKGLEEPYIINTFTFVWICGEADSPLRNIPFAE